METPLPEVLLQHGQFVRALAYRLLRDPHLADDAAQETWLRYLEHRPKDGGSLRGWLHRVVTNWSANKKRTSASHAARELVEAPGAADSAGDEAARAELLARVAAAVVTLDAPYRDTILERYYRGRSASEIAAATGTSLATVRSREQRALEKLRAALDREHGSRAAWAVALARLTGAPPAAPVPLGWMPKTAAALVLAVAAAGVLWFALGGHARTEPGAATSAARAAPSDASEAGLRTPPMSEARTPVEAASASSSGAEGRALATAAQHAEIRARFTFPGGAPAAGAHFRLRGFGANQERVLAHGLPEHWADPAGATDADGRLALSFDPPRAFQFILDVAAPAHAAASWRWSEIAPDAVLELGEIELPVGATLEGRIVDKDGNPLTGESWTVYANSIGLAGPLDRDETRVFARTHGGAFHLEQVWPARVELQAHSEMANWIAGPRVTIASGETRSVDIVYRGPDNSRRITVTISSHPYYVVPLLAPPRIQLLGAGSEPRLAFKIPGASDSWSFDDLEPGSYAVELDDPRYDPWSRTAVAPGTELTARLTGSSAVRLTVLDADEHEAALYAVRVVFLGANFSLSEFEVHDGAHPLADGLLDGMFAGDYRISARLADGRAGFVEVAGLAPGETRAATIHLAATASLSGRVVSASGEPVAGAEVWLLAPAEVDDSDASRVMLANGRANDLERWRREIGRTASDVDGNFRFALPHAGAFVAMALNDGPCHASSPVLTVAAGESTGTGDLALPLGGRVHGRVLAPQGASCAGLRLRFEPIALQMWEIMAQLRPVTLDLAADGAFESGPLHTGTNRVLLLPPASRSESSNDAVELTRFEVPSDGTIEATFDGRAFFPGTVRLVVEVNGQPRAGLQPSFVADEGGGDASEDEATSAAGTFGPYSLRPGSYRLEIRDVEHGWTHVEAAPLVIEPATETHLAVSIAEIHGTVRLTAARGGEPLRERTIAILCEGFPREFVFAATRLTSDANGDLALALTPGSYELVLDPPTLGEGGPPPAVDEASLRSSTLVWTSGGPAAATLGL